MVSPHSKVFIISIMSIGYNSLVTGREYFPTLLRPLMAPFIMSQHAAY